MSPIPLTNKKMIFAIVNDITERKKAEEHITYLAYHDSLTGLPNRKYFYERLSQELQRGRRSSGKFAVLYLDLDGFKEINDNYGHEIGDYILCETGNRIRESIRSSDIVARIGGDEFTLLILDIQRPDDAKSVAQKIISSLSPPAFKDGVTVSIHASIGISIFPDDGENADALIHSADKKMYSVKRIKKDSISTG